MSMLIRCLALAPFFTATAMAAVAEVDIPVCKLAPGAITIDGRLDDWVGVEGKLCQPLKAFNSKSLAEQRADLTAELRTAYDAKALYVAIAWASPLPPANRSTGPDDWQLGGDGVAVHLVCDGLAVQVVSFPRADGQTASLFIRRDGESAWRDLAAEGGAAAITAAAKGYGQELRIPWTALNRTGEAQVDRPMPIMVDLAWQALPTTVLQAVGADLRRDAMHFSYNVLTSRQRLLSRTYLPSPVDWGDLVLADTPVGARREDTLLGSGVVALTVGRTATPPVIDGTQAAGEWPAAALSDHAYAGDLLGDRYGMRLGLLSDDANLYLSARMTTPGAPLNSEPEETQQGFKGGDCLQIRLARADKIVNLCTWYDSLNHRMALTADGKDLAHPLLLQHGAKAAMGAVPGSYTLELALPWSELFAGSAPHAGDRLKASFQPWYAGLDPRFTFSGSLALEQRSPLDFSYTMPRDAEVTLGVYDASGLRRWLTRSEFRRAGANTEHWDGRDQDGTLLTPGTYEVKALYHDQLGLEHRLSVGNPGTPPWTTPDGSGDWMGDESNPQAATTDGDWVYLASPGSEFGFTLIGVDGTGQRRWGIPSNDTYPRCVSLAVQGDVLFAAYCGPEKNDTQSRFTGKNADNRVVLRCYDKRTGAPMRFTRSQPSLKVAVWPYQENLFGLWELFNAKSFDPDTYGGLPRYGDSQFGEAAEAMGVAATADTVWIAFHTQGVLRAYDAQTGAATPARDIPVAKPVSLLARPDGSLLAVSGKQVVRIDPTTRAVVPVVTAGLVAPFGVAADKAGNIYVSDWRDSFQVKVFSPDGRPLRTIGKPGGRAVLGKWDAGGMLVPRGIAVTDAGRLWVVEDDGTPRRVSVWDAASGALVRDYIGPTPYGGGSVFWMEPGDQTVLHTIGTRFKLDWAKQTWTPEASELRRMSHDQPFALCGATGMAHSVRAMRREGREYAVVPAGIDQLVVMEHQGDVWQPVAAVGTIHRWQTDDGSGQNVWDSDVGVHMVKGFRPDCFRGHSGDNFAWSDRNHDGLVQASEMTFQHAIFRGETFAPGTQPEFLLNWGHGCDDEWNLYLGGECKVEGGDDHVLFRLSPQGWTADGVPLFDIAKAVPVTTAHGFNAIYADARKLIYTAGTEDTTADAITCYNRAGAKLWRIAGKAKPLPNEVVASNISGEMELPGIGPAVGTWAWHGNNRAFLLSSDGLYIGTVQEETRLGPAALWGESWRRWYQAPDGTLYLVNGSNDANHFLKVTGLEHSGRFAGHLTITAEDAVRMAAARSDATVRVVKKSPVAVQWRDAPAIDGDLADWDLGYGTTIPLGKGREAVAALARDADTLYLAYQVDDDSPLLNQGGNWQTLFMTGDCVDLMLATDPASTATRSAPAAGDLRLLLSVFQGKPVAVLYRPVVPGTTKPVQLMAARIDRVELLSQARVAVRRTSAGYTIEAAVPFAALGLAPESTQSLRGDLGVVSSDLAGRDRVKRSYHFNADTEMVSDLTTEASLTPAAWGEVRFPLGKNLLRDGGFENGFAAKPEDGWALVDVGGGMRVTTSSDAAFSGQRGLLLRQLVPVTYPATAFAAADFANFTKAANGGAGGGHATVSQHVAVVGGRQYAFRFAYRADGLKLEDQRPGPGRGFSTLMPWIYWTGGAGGQVWVANIQQDTQGWSEKYNVDTGNFSLAHPYRAPQGATGALVVFYGAVNAPDNLPRISVDDVEMVEVVAPAPGGK